MIFTTENTEGTEWINKDAPHLEPGRVPSLDALPPTDSLSLNTVPSVV